MDDDVTVVTATRRLARQVEEDYARRQQAAGRQAWPAPEVRYAPDWLAEEWENLPQPGFGDAVPVLLDSGQERVLWEEVCETAAPAEFAGDRVTLAAALQEAWALCREWQLEIARFARPASDEVELLMRAASTFEQQLAAQGWISAAQLPGALGAAALAGTWRPRPTLWLGFDEPTPALRALCAALAAQGALVESPLEEARAGVAELFPCPDENEEIHTAARWARALIERGETGAIGIVFQGLGTRRNEIVRVFCDVFGAEDAEPEAALNGLVHVSLGRPLAEYPIVAHALLALDMLVAPPGIETLAEFLHSPFFAGGMSETGARARLELRLRETGRERWPLPVLAPTEHDCPQLRRVLNGAGEWMRDRPQSAAEWARWATQALASFGWPGERTLTSTEYQTIAAWHELLARFARLSAVAGPMTMNAAVRRITRMARERLFQPQADPAPVQILGLPEVAGLGFSQLWIAGASDDAWPGAPRPNPFIPLTLQRSLGMPHADAVRELDFARRVTRGLLSAAPRVVVSHAQWREDAQLNISPLFAHLPRAREMSLSPFTGHARRLHETAPPLEAYGDWQGPALSQERPKGGVRIIADQAACPFRAFARHRLSACEPEIVKPGLDPRTHGLLVHAALDRFWKELKSHTALESLSGDQERQLVERHVDSALREHADPHADGFRRALIEIERRRLVRLLLAWLQCERQRPAFEVLVTEKPRTLKLDAMELQLRVDRMDRLADGRRLLLDYKTGDRVGPGAWLGPRPDEPQLPIYALATEPAPDGIAFARLHAAGPKFAGLASGPGMAKGIKPSVEGKNAVAWPELIAQWRATLDALAGGFARGDAAADPKQAGTCRNCEVMPLCRLHELRPQGEFAEEEGAPDE